MNSLLKASQLKGAFTALVTPFRQGKVDEAGLRKIIDTQIDQGIDGLVACGTTGESPTLSEKEHLKVIELTVQFANGRVPVIAGTGSNNTLKAMEKTQQAREVGAQASLNVCPYYSKPTQQGIIDHFEYLAGECDLPIILYNIPGRTGVNMSVETILQLAEHANIIGVKEASGSCEQAGALLAACLDDFAILSGDDALTLPIMALGGTGVVSTTSNVTPQWMAALCKNMNEGRLVAAQELHFKLLPLFEALFCESNPVPVKTALSLMGLIVNEIRLPLSVLKPESVERVRQALKDLELI